MVTTSPIDSENEVDGECAVSVSRCAAMQNFPRPREVALAFVENRSEVRRICRYECRRLDTEPTIPREAIALPRHVFERSPPAQPVAVEL
ncbi:hypothetical protein A2J02_12100 [Rhodococcus sp. EPR-147]|nr:hypothetical protein A2J02_12100 [Rhodococcus sp. EPR-147]